MKRGFLLLLLAVSSAPCLAQSTFWDEIVESAVATGGYFTAEELYRNGRGAFAYGYVTAVADSDRTSTPLGSRYCMPAGVTNGQATDVAWKFMEAHPEQRHLSAAHVVRLAFRGAWPCR